MKSHLLITIVALAVCSLGCDKKEQPPSSVTNLKISAGEARTIARDAYIYGFPMVMNLKTIYDYVLRLYGPKTDALEGKWTPPTVKKI